MDQPYRSAFLPASLDVVLSHVLMFRRLREKTEKVAEEKPSTEDVRETFIEYVIPQTQPLMACEEKRKEEYRA